MNVVARTDVSDSEVKRDATVASRFAAVVVVALCVFQNNTSTELGSLYCFCCCECFIEALLVYSVVILTQHGAINISNGQLVLQFFESLKWLWK